MAYIQHSLITGADIHNPKDHAHQGIGADGAKLDHGAALNGLADDDHSQYLNEARHDLVVRHQLEVGGTGAATAAGARTNLAVVGTADIIPIAKGGTGTSTAAGARANLGSTTVGDALFVAASDEAARTTLDLGWIDSRAYATLELGDAAAAAAGKLLVISQNHTLTANTVLTASILRISGGSFTQPAAWTLAINGTFSNPNNGQCFIGFVSGDVTFGLGTIRKAFPEWWGLTTVSTAAVNAVALQAAIDSRAPIVNVPSGHYDYSTDLTFDRAIRFDGAGSCEDNGAAGYGTTVLHYTGAGIGIDIIGSGTNGKENIHLSNFSLAGNNAATGGIYSGSGVNVTKGSTKNVHIIGFTKTNGYGLRLGNCLEALFENVYAQANYDGFVSLSGGDSTTLKFVNCQSRSNTRFGGYFVGALRGSSFHTIVFESNGSDGLYIYGAGIYGLAFHSCWAEGNNTSAGTEQLFVGGAPGDLASDITFYNWLDMDYAAGTRTHEIFVDAATRIQFFYPKLQVIEHMKVGTLATRCEVFAPLVRYTAIPIIGNTTGQMRVYTIQTDYLVTDDTSPSVGTQYPNYKMSSTVPITITNFDDGFDGQVFTITFLSGQILIADGGNFKLAAGVAFDSANDGYAHHGIKPSISFVNVSGVWHEITRTII